MRASRCSWPRWALALIMGTSLLLAACSTARPAAPAASGVPSQPGASTAPAGPVAADPFVAAKTMPLVELHQKALAEGGAFSFYATIAAATAERLFPAFEQRFPGIKVEQVDATGDRLVARIISEARGGKTLTDAFHSNIGYLQQLHQQGVFVQEIPLEAMALPEEYRGPYWFSTALQFIVVGYNTSRVRPDEVPTGYEDFAEPRWKDRLMLDPSDVELLAGLVRKYGNEERAADLLRRIAANNPAHHRGHSELAELLAAGQGDVCLTCYADHIRARTRRGAPVEYMRSEGIGQLSASAALKDAPHPYTAMLWQRWAASEEGQQAYAEAGRIPAHPNVASREALSPEKVYPLGADEVQSMRRYEATWKGIFQVR